ncbi:MAG: hypothetical protein IJ634_07095 [Bacteroidales bacterium]|nr:hypothetical protein [Bacteroidales bacterium]
MTKKIKRLMLVAATLILGAGIATSCGKDDEKPTENNIPEFTIADLAGTSWSGTYMDVLYHNGQHQMLFTWTLDFNADGKGMVMMEVTSPVIEEIVEEFPLTYTYDGVNHGEITYTGYEFEYTSEFVVDGLNRSLDANLWMHFRLSEDDTVGQGTLFGGRTTLYKVE